MNLNFNLSSHTWLTATTLDNVTLDLNYNHHKHQNTGLWPLPGAGGRGKWGGAAQRVQTSSNKINKFGDLMYNTVIIANDTVPHT